jgi:hypothetical protein
MTPEEARERVARGAALLDAQMPDWFTRIDVGALNIRRDCHCVLGQLESSFMDAVERRWGLNPNGCPDYEAVAHGFTISPCMAWKSGTCQCQSCNLAWRLLQDAWIAAITDRVIGCCDEAQAVATAAPAAVPSNT